MEEEVRMRKLDEKCEFGQQIQGAGVEWVVGQAIDISWTNIRHLSKVCPIFVNYLSMSNSCQNFVMNV